MDSDFSTKSVMALSQPVSLTAGKEDGGKFQNEHAAGTSKNKAVSFH
jgi:hypothetical protein